MKAFAKLFIISLLLTLISCSSKPLTEKDNNRTIELPVDTPFQIQLKADKSSKDEWKLVSFNKPTIILKSINIETDDTEDTVIFNFVTQTTGKEVIRIEYGNKDKQNNLFELRVICGTMGRILSE